MEYKTSHITVLTGPMMSGKSKEIFSVIDKLTYRKIPFIIFKPDIDVRALDLITTRYLKQNFKSISIDIKNPALMIKHLDLEAPKFPFYIIIDEAQFFDMSLVDIIKNLTLFGYSFFIAGLDTDAKQKTFGPMGNLLAIADEVIKICAVCEKCHEFATKTTFKKEWPDFDKNNIWIDTGIGDEVYAILCNKCSYAANEQQVKNLLNNFLLNCQ